MKTIFGFDALPAAAAAQHAIHKAKNSRNEVERVDPNALSERWASPQTAA